MTKLIIPGEANNASLSSPREALIKNFLKDWLTDKQISGMGPWYTEMLDAFMTEVLLKAQKVGIEKLLLVRPGTGIIENMMKEISLRQDRSNRYPLAIVPKEIKPKKMQVTLEEVSGDLASETKSVLLSDVKTEV